MKQKSLFYLLACCAWAFLIFTACDDDNKDVPPTVAVSNLVFTNTSENPDNISGTLSWMLPSPEGDITGYSIYLASSTIQREKALAIVPNGTTSFEVPAGTEYYPYLVVVAVNKFGESSNLAGVSVDPYQREGIYILNGGNGNENNASLSFYDINAGTMTGDLYKTANGSGLGDSGEQILIYGSKVYITVPTSNRLVVLDKNDKLLKSIEPKEGTHTMNPRRMVAHEGKIYVSYFYGHSAAVLDTTSLSIEKTVPVGRYPEQLTVANGKLYVANSGGLDFPNYGKTVSVVDLASFQVEKTIDVLLNPVQVASDYRGNVYVISMGDYEAVKNTLQRIDAQTGEVTIVDNASHMTMVGDKLYYIYAQWGAPEMKFKIYDTQTEKIANDKFITDDTKLTFPQDLAINPATGKIYIADSPSKATGSLYIYSTDGKQEGSPIDTKGYYPKSIAFLSK